MTEYSLYLVLAAVIAALVTFSLRALPFAMLKKLRKSKFVAALGKWMPVGILLLLALVTIKDSFAAASHWWITPVSLVVTIAVHFLTRRKTVLSVAAGCACYIVLTNLL